MAILCAMSLLKLGATFEDYMSKRRSQRRKGRQLA